MKHFIIYIILILSFGISAFAQQKDTLRFGNYSLVVPLEGLYRSYYKERNDGCSSWIEANYLIKSQLTYGNYNEKVEYKGPSIVCFISSSRQSIDDLLETVNEGVEQGGIEWAMSFFEDGKQGVRFVQEDKSKCFIFFKEGQIQIGYVNASPQFVPRCNTILKAIEVNSYDRGD